jgi:hypothetical protein
MRPEMAITWGATVGDSNAAQIVASMTGGGYITVMLDRREVDDAMPSFGYGGDMHMGDFYEYYYDEEFIQTGW